MHPTVHDFFSTCKTLIAFLIFTSKKWKKEKRKEKRILFSVHDFLFPFTVLDFPRILNFFPYFLFLIATETKFYRQKMEKNDFFSFLCACLPSYLDLRDYLPILFPLISLFC
jgi:hypothetical protein